MKEMAVFPVPYCCGAAILIGFGHDTNGPKYYDKLRISEFGFNNLLAQFEKIMDEFQNSRGQFAPFSLFNDHIVNMPNCYQGGGRSHLVAYLTTAQERDWEETLKKYGWSRIDEFRNKKSGNTVALWRVERDSDEDFDDYSDEDFDDDD